MDEQEKSELRNIMKTEELIRENKELSKENRLLKEKLRKTVISGETYQKNKELSEENRKLSEENAVLKDKLRQYEPELFLPEHKDSYAIKKITGWTPNRDKRGYWRIFRRIRGKLFHAYIGKKLDQQKVRNAIIRIYRSKAYIKHMGIVAEQSGTVQPEEHIGTITITER
jgi:regulator of replication initiation timing